MYASDAIIRDLLPQMAIQTDDPAEPFDAETQVQPCSIDMRLGASFWRPLRSRAMDLRRSKLLEIEPRRYYRRQVVRSGESITLRPGRLLLAHVYEEFSVPAGYAAELTGRSSFSRMGLMIHCGGGFINPGYRGHMPLQLLNLSPNSIRLFPHIPICQIRLIKLEGAPSRLYGHQELQSKYMDDDGGPSYWWRDKRIIALHQKLGERDIAVAIQQEILKIVGPQEPEVIERMEKAIDKLSHAEIDNAASFLEAFAAKEEMRRRRRTGLLWAIRLIAPALAAASIRTFFQDSCGWPEYILWILTGLTAPISYLAAVTDVGEHLGRKELTKSQSKK